MSRKKTEEEKKLTKRLWRLRNKEKLNKCMREKYNTDTSFKEDRKKRASNYFKSNRDKCLVRFKNSRESNGSYMIEYRLKNRDKLLRQGSEYRIKNRQEINRKARVRLQNTDKDIVRWRSQIRRAKLRSASGMFTLNQWLDRLFYHGNRCYYCHCEGTMTIDHRIPLSKGGTNWPSNLVPACKSCNSSKRDKTEQEFKIWSSKYKQITL